MKVALTWACQRSRVPAMGRSLWCGFDGVLGSVPRAADLFKLSGAPRS